MKTRIGQILPFSLLILPFGLISGCAIKSKTPDPPEGYFATYIEDDGTKKFQYSVELPESRGKGGKKWPGGGKQRPGNVAGQVSGGSSSGLSAGVTTGTNNRGKNSSWGSGPGRSGKINEQLDKILEQELAESGFCHDGYRATDWDLEPPSVYIRGECTENATEEDWDHFPNDGD